MYEQLGPCMARSIMGAAYDPDRKYALETAEDGFHVIILDPKTGEKTTLKLEPEPVDAARMTPIWQDELEERLPQNDLWSRFLLGVCLLVAGLCAAWALSL